MKGYIEKSKRKTILFLADDMRLPSGIGTMTRELIIGNAHKYNFVHVGAAINHPDVGKIQDLSADVNKETGLTDSSVLLYPYNGYGDPELVRLLIERHSVDAIVHSQIQDIGFGYTECPQSLDNAYPYSIITFGMTCQLHTTIDLIMSLVTC